MKPRSAIPLMVFLSCIFGCDNDKPYTKKDGTWYFNKTAMVVQPGETLTPINAKFATTQRSAYYESAMIASDVDVASFEALSDHYAKDQHNVWYCDTYRDSREFWLQKRYRTARIERADPASFRILRDNYARDNRLVYLDGEGFKVRDIETYERISYAHARDRVSGYYMRAEIPGSDGPSFTSIDGSYSKDAKRVYWSEFTSDGGTHPGKERTTALPGAQPASFALLENGYARDGGQVYYESRVLSNNPTTFRVLERDYAIADSMVFFRGAILPGADGATFIVLTAIGEGATAQDKLGKFNYEKRVQQ